MEPNDLMRWYIDAARYFRPMGFFSKYSQFPDEAVALRLKEDVCRLWDEPYPPGSERHAQVADMYLLSTDAERVWCADLECVCPGENAYPQFLDEIAVISRGAFRPRDITEKWKGERGPAEVSFTAGGKRYTFIHKGGDMLDPSIIRTVNGAIADSGTGFVVCDNFGMPNFVLALSREERALLAARGWKFWSGT